MAHGLRAASTHVGLSCVACKRFLHDIISLLWLVPLFQGDHNFVDFVPLSNTCEATWYWIQFICYFL